MTIALFGKNIAPENGDYMRRLFNELSDNQVEITVYQPFADLVKTFVPEGVKYRVFHSHDDLNADILFSIGGDGTILDTVPFVRDSGMPVLGINMGRLGFLSSISKNEIGEAVKSVLAGDYSVEHRTLYPFGYADWLYSLFTECGWTHHRAQCKKFRHHAYCNAQFNRPSRRYS